MARFEAPRGVGSGEVVSPSPVGVGSGEEAVPPPQKYFFLCGNNAFWCTFDVCVSPTSEKNSELLSHRSGAF